MNSTDLVFGNGLLFALVILEAVIALVFFKETFPWKELILNLNSGHILMWIFRGVEVTLFYYVSLSFSTGLVTFFPVWGQWLIAFLLWDFLFYWLHRTHHYFKFLWKIHVVHHEGEHFSLSLGIRNSWYSSLSSFPYFIILAVIGVSVEVFVTVSSIHYFIQFYNHNHFIRKSGWLDYFLVTPMHHRVHHGKNEPYIDKNFGGTLLVWDKIFGTFQTEIFTNKVEIGIHDASNSYNPIIINNSPFISKLKTDELKLKKLIHIPAFFLISGAVMLFLTLLCFIYIEKSWEFYPKLVLFSIVFIGTIGNGMLSDGNPIGIWVWFFSAVIAPILFFLCFSSQIFCIDLALILLILLGILTTFQVWFSTKHHLTK